MTTEKLNEVLAKYKNAGFENATLADIYRQLLADGITDEADQEQVIGALHKQPDLTSKHPAEASINPDKFGKYDSFRVEAIREASPDNKGATKVTGYKVLALDATITASHDDVKKANSFQIAHNGKRLYPAGKYKAGDTITV